MKEKAEAKSRLVSYLDHVLESKAENQVSQNKL